MARRKGTRYLGILRGSNEVARNRLIQYFKGEIKPSYPERSGPRPDTVAVYVNPFGIPLGTNKGLKQEANAERYPSFSAFVAGFVYAAAPTAANQVVLQGLLAPRAAITIGRSASGTAAVSKISGRSYKSYGGNSASIPFGEGAETAEKSEEAVFKIIQSRVKAANVRNVCSFVPGSYSLT